MFRGKKWRWLACKVSPRKQLLGLLLISRFIREFHREQLSIEHSMQDLDSAVGRLDNILMSVYAVVAILLIAVALVLIPS
jgi:hypothetical protein